MAETTIETILRLKDQLSGPLRSVGSGIAATARQINGLNDQLRQTASTALGMKGQIAGALAGIGVGIGVKEILDLSSNFEDTALSIAGNIKAFDLAPTFEKSRIAATDALNIIDEMSAKLPGEADQYIQVFKTALPKAIESGLGSVKEVADFTSKYTAVAVSNQIDAMQAGMDLMRMLGGQAGLDVRTWQALNPHLKVTKEIMKELGGKVKGLKEGAGLTAEMFNRLAITTRRELIEKTIGKFDEQLVAAGDTFSAKMGELTSRVKKLIRLASEPMFEAAKKTLGDINAYLEQNGDKLKATLGDLFNKLADLAPKILDTLKFALDHAEGIKNAMVIAAGAWATSNILSTLGGALGIAQKIGAALGIGGAAAGAAGAAGGAAKLGGGMLASVVPHVAALTAGAAIGGYSMEWAMEASKKRKMQLHDLRSPIEEAWFEHEKERLSEAGVHYWNTSKMAAETVHKWRESQSQWDAWVSSVMGTKTPFERWNAAAAANAVITPKTPGGRTQPPNNDFRHSRFDIRQTFAEGFDPDRIAVAFSQDLARVGEMKLQAARNMQSGFVR